MENDDVLNINDFTAVTPVEQLAHQLESIINEWNIGGRITPVDYPKSLIKTGIVHDFKEKRLKLGDEEILLTYFYPKKDLPALQHNLATPLNPSQLLCDLENTNLDLYVGHPITAMFGPIKFLTLRLPESTIISSEDVILYLKNAFVSAAEASQCYLPCFILNNYPAKQLYSGISIGEESYTTFESALLRKGQRQHQHLSGLLSLFKAKVDTPTFRSQTDVRVSVMFEYERIKLPENGIFHLDEALVPTLDMMCIGSEDSPIERISLLASWPNQSEDVLNEGHNYCDLEETNAFDWQFVINFEPKEGCLAKTLRSLLDVGNDRDADYRISELRSIRNRKHTKLNDTGIRGNSFGQTPSITNPANVEYDPENVLPMNPEKQDIWLNAITAVQKPAIAELPAYVKTLYERTKSMDAGSVLDRLATAFYSLSIDQLHWKNSNCQLFMAFIDKTRSEYSKMKTNEDIQVPNYSKCRLHQLFEMLQLCANNRNMFFELMDESMSGGGMDEFYDAYEDADESAENYDKKSKENLKESSPRDDSKDKGLGRREHHQNMFLLKRPEVPLFDFHTQNPKPHTENEIKNLELMCADSEDDPIQFNMYLAPLRSDIQAFKAANPHGQFEDFVRWHSPKDFDEDTKTLSARFDQPDNDWINLWENVSPASVIAQEKLFNDAAVKEEIFADLENLTVLEVTHMMLPIVFIRAAAELIKLCYKSGNLIEMDVIKQKIKLLVEALSKATNSGDRDDYLQGLKWIVYLEKALMVYKAAQEEIFEWIKKSSSEGPVPTTDEVDQLVCYLTEMWDRSYSGKEETTLFPRGYFVAGGASSPMGIVLHKLMCNEKTDAQNFRVFPRPTNRFYTIHWVTVSPSDGSRPVPHRMTAILTEDEFRICGSYTNDVKKG